MDDIEENTYLVSHILKINKAVAITLNRAEEALERYKVTSDIDAIITDLRMPGMSGQQFITEIRRFECISGRKAVPIIVLTAESDPEERLLCLSKYGANEYLIKPIPLVELMQSLYKAMHSIAAKGLSILIVDDEPMASFLMSKILTGQGHKTTIRASIEEVLICSLYVPHIRLKMS